MTRPARRRRRRGIWIAPILVLLAVAAYLPLTLAAPLRSTAAVPVHLAVATPAPATLAWPGYGASALVVPGAVDQVVTHGSTAALPMASITKLITAEVVLEQHPLAVGQPGPAIRFTEADVAISRRYIALDGRVSPVVAGSSLTQLQVMQLALVHSANNYAESLAIWAYGSVPAYLTAARAWLHGKGLDGLHIVDPTGISDSDAGATSDIVKLGRTVLADPLVASLVSTKHISVPGVGDFDNSNELLGSGGIDGVKTGTLDDFGANLLFSAHRTVGDRTFQVVGVVLGGPDHPTVDADVDRLLDSVQAGFHPLALVTAGQVLGTYSTAWGERAPAVAATAASVVVWSDARVSSRVVLRRIVTDRAGSSVGDAEFTAGGTRITVPVRLQAAVADPGAGWRLTHPFDLGH